MTDIIGYTYSALCVLGGAIGYAKSGSLPSIIAGSAIGLINAGGTYGLQNGQQNGHFAQLGSSGLMAGVMGKKFLKTGKMMPPGFFFGISSVYFGYTVFNNYVSNSVENKEE